jgi:hypothetical protein
MPVLTSVNTFLCPADLQKPKKLVILHPSVRGRLTDEVWGAEFRTLQAFTFGVTK